MSYEGYEQLMCKNGHAWSQDASYNYDDTFGQQCAICSSPAIWWNAVDTTNGSYNIDCYGNEIRIDGYVKFEVLTKAETCICSCSHQHTKPGSETTYKLPPVNVGHHQKALDNAG